MNRDTLLRIVITLLLLAVLIPAARLTAHAAPLPAAAAPDGTLWRWLGGGDISDVFFLGDGRHGWAATTQGFLLRTEDGGARWQYVPNVPVSKVYFVSAYRGYGIGGGGIWLTTDSGLTWTAQQTGVSGSDIQFVSVTEGWVAAGSAVYRTVDGGTSWTPHQIISGTVVALSFVDNQRGWATDRTRIQGTTDGGITWDVLAIFPHTYYGYNYFPDDLFFVSSTEGWIVGAQGEGGEYGEFFAKTSDGGVTWTEYRPYGLLQPTQPTKGGVILDASISMHGYNGWIAFDYSGTLGVEKFLWATTDGGVTWHRTLPNSWHVKAFYLPEWAGGYHGMASNWFLWLSALALANAQHGIIAGGDGDWQNGIFWSDDSGRTFHQVLEFYETVTLGVR